MRSYGEASVSDGKRLCLYATAGTSNAAVLSDPNAEAPIPVVAQTGYGCQLHGLIRGVYPYGRSLLPAAT